ncbi:hypothetical protein AT251_10475 [Enterovibrio nigricans]|nr:hypothetical protein [Enterovibrio nigricans]PKF50598.1 hypothetical protein AT251_10475 [Enterovibrio nigricans]
MRNQEKGIATLAVVSGIAMVVALFSVAVIKSGVNEVNKANNLVELAQDKAHARASIDCAAGLFKQLGLNPSTMVAGDFSDCKSDASTVFGIVDGGSLWTISAQHGYATSRFSVRQTSSKAAFRTAGSVEITGGNSWAPAAGDVVTIDGVQYVECTAIVAGGTITIDVGSSAAAFDTLKPIDSSLDCAPTHDTHIAAGSGSVTDGFGKDMVSNADIESIFEEIFGRPKSEWESVRSEEGFYVINTGSAITNKAAVEGCGAAIKTAINGDPAADPPIGKHDKIWVMGDCMLNGVTHAGDAFQSPLVVIQNGIVGAEWGNLTVFEVQSYSLRLITLIRIWPRRGGKTVEVVRMAQ